MLRAQQLAWQLQQTPTSVARLSHLTLQINQAWLEDILSTDWSEKVVPPSDHEHTWLLYPNLSKSFNEGVVH